MPDKQALVDYKNVSCIGLQGSLSLQNNAGDLIALVGDNVQDQASVLLSLAGLQDIQSGSIYRAYDEERHIISYAGPDIHLISTINCLTNITLPSFYHRSLENRKHDKASLEMKALQYLQELGIEHCQNLLPEDMGQYEHLLALIARNMMFEPDIIYIDESEACLDSLSKAKLAYAYKVLLDHYQVSIVLLARQTNLLKERSKSLVSVYSGQVQQFDSWDAFSKDKAFALYESK